jgi:hypothetical protein
MFVQVINGKVADGGAARKLGERWVSELGADASGWLGSTAGVTADGELVVLARFASAEAAQRNSERPEQGAWWAEMEKLFVEEPRFADYDDVLLVGGGGSDEAGFVQVMVDTPRTPIGSGSSPRNSRRSVPPFVPTSSVVWSVSMTMGPLLRLSTLPRSRTPGRVRSWSRRRSFALPSRRSRS